MEKQTVKINTPFIKLDALLKLANVCSSGGHAKMLIQDGLVSVDGVVTYSRGAKIQPGQTIDIISDTPVKLIVTQD